MAYMNITTVLPHSIEGLKTTRLSGAIHRNHICRFYIDCINIDSNKFNNKIYNVGFENLKIIEVANMIKNTLKINIPITVTKTDDIRSYHISSNKVNKEFGFYANKQITDAIVEIDQASKSKLVIDPLNNSNYYNLSKMKELKLV